MKKIIYFAMCLCAFAMLSGCTKQRDDEYYSNKQPLSDYEPREISDIEIIAVNVEDMTKENALDIVLGYYGLELNIPENWTVKDAKGENLNETDTRCSLTFTNLTEEERDEYISTFYEDYHLGEKKLEKFKTDDGYKWDVQIKGVSIKDTYTFKISGSDLTLIIEKTF